MPKEIQRLHHYIENTLLLESESVYLKSSTQTFKYTDVYKMAVAFRKVLIDAGIQKGERVIIYSSKNAHSIAMMIACSLCNCIYVPVSSSNPFLRFKFIVDETSARFILCDTETENELRKIFDPEIIYNDESISILSILSSKNEIIANEDAAFILYTSGSTGTPKGVAISHRAAITFIDWIATEFEINQSDIIASIAPFNFDLSVFDIYVTAKKAATLVLYTESETKNALLMAKNLSVDKISAIYATPSFFSMLAFYGKMQKYDYPSLKTVLFAGEVFYMENFKALHQHWPNKIYVNLYGPTETNVCTFFRVNINQLNYTEFPIGKPCSYAKTFVADKFGNEIIEKNITGELMVSGSSLFMEYWNDTGNTSASLLKNKNNISFYKTGDLVFVNNEGDFVYVSRKDRMIKKNGFRIEPLEIERIVSAYPNVSNTAVLFDKDKNQIICFVEHPLPFDDYLNKLKLFCQNSLSTFMIPDKFVILESIPKTNSGKVDLQSLENQL